MSANPPGQTSVRERLHHWLGAKLDIPTNRQLRSQNELWDYAQVDSGRLWDREVEPERLRAAMRLLRTAPDKAVEELLDLALTGSVVAMNVVGERYYWGRGVAMDERLGETWFRKAFEGGSQRGLLNYGKALRWRGDLVLAEAVFRSGADQDWAPALYWLAVVLTTRSAGRQARREARLLLERAAAKGSLAAKWRLSRDMAHGRYGFLEIPRGFRLLYLAAQEMRVAWETGRKARATTTAAGETLH
jgi:TPR repeat protein